MARTYALAVLSALSLAACGSSSSTTPESSSETTGTEQTVAVAPAPAPEPAPIAEPTPPPAPVAETPKLANAAAVVSHRVKDYDAWKKAFDEGEPMRKEAGITAHHVSRGVKDPSLVVTYFSADDKAKLETFLADKALAETMKKNGVIGKPTIEHVTPIENKTAADPALPAAIVEHEVKDYDAWKTAFDGDTQRRSDAGLVGYTLNRDQKKPNVVVMYVQGQTREQVDAYFADPALKTIMKDAGVKGQPKVTALQGVEWNQYAR
jgi:quinol monooxygenase YgiN